MSNAESGPVDAMGGGDTGEKYWAHVRHEFRTPLNQIIGYGEMLEEDATAAKQAAVVADLRKIRQAAEVLQTLVAAHLNPLWQATQEKPAARIDQWTKYSVAGDHEDAALDLEAMQGHILVVDDDQINREMLSRRLERSGLTTRAAGDGKVALEQLREEDFDLILLDIMMPVMNGFETLQAIKQDSRLKYIPVIMISGVDELEAVIRCIEIGAEDYLPKPFNHTLLRARISACLERKSLRDAEQTYLAAIEQTQNRLSKELKNASAYVQSIFPPAMQHPLRVDWLHRPCSELGGDAFGYHWLDDTHFAIYVLDVCGHGVGSSLLSATAINVIRAGCLPGVDPQNPSEVLAAMNNLFQMERQNNMFFTLWYGVYDSTARRLRYGGGGHPASILVPAQDAAESAAIELESTGGIIGMMEDIEFESRECSIPPGSSLFVISDGCLEIFRPDGSMLSTMDLIDFLKQQGTDQHALDQWYARCLQERGGQDLDDDFTMVRVCF